MPWKKEEALPIDLTEAKEILNRQHYGLEKVKERILQHLAVMQLKKRQKGIHFAVGRSSGNWKDQFGKKYCAGTGTTVCPPESGRHPR